MNTQSVQWLRITQNFPFIGTFSAILWRQQAFEPVC